MFINPIQQSNIICTVWCHWCASIICDGIHNLNYVVYSFCFILLKANGHYLEALTEACIDEGIRCRNKIPQGEQFSSSTYKCVYLMQLKRFELCCLWLHWISLCFCQWWYGVVTVLEMINFKTTGGSQQQQRSVSSTAKVTSSQQELDRNQKFLFPGELEIISLVLSSQNLILPSCFAPA